MAGTRSVGRSHRYRASGNSISSLPTNSIRNLAISRCLEYYRSSHSHKSRLSSQYYPM